MRRLALIALALLGLAGIADAAMKAGPPVMSSHHRLRAGTPVFAGAGVDIDFTTSRYFPSTTTLTTTRASTGYAVDVSGNWVSFAANTPRITNLGLMVEESRTNGIRNNTMQGAVAGTPGTIPTNWTAFTNPGLTQTIVGTGVQNGVSYIDIRFSGTSTGVLIALNFETTTGVAAVNGQTWSYSVFLALVGGSLTNVTSSTLGLNQRDSGAAFLGQVTAAIALPTAAFARQSAVLTTNLALTAFVLPQLNLGVTNGAAVDLTIRVGWPQLELGSWATTPIATAGVAATRAADVVTLASPPVFGSAYTLYGAGVPQAPAAYGTFQFLFCVDDGTASNRAMLYRGVGTGTATAQSQSGGVSSLPANSVVWGSGVSGRFAEAVSAGLQAASFNGGVVGTTAGALPIGVSAVRVGSNNGGGAQWNGTIQRIALWPTTALTGAQLQALTQ